jgi:glycine/D-amino acid oxidase-like deaminating enzyme
VFLQDHPSLKRLHDVNVLLHDVIGDQPFCERNDLRSDYQLSASVFALVHTTYEGTLHSGRMLQALWKRAAELGVHIRTGTEVSSIDADAAKVTLHCSSPHQRVDLTCSQVVVATNAMIPSLVQSPVIPVITAGRGQVLVSAPVQGLSLRGSFHLDEGYCYFRELDGRVLLGGGRNLDFAGETTTSHDVTDRIQHALEDLLRTVILPTHHDVAIEHRWAGTMAFTENNQPVVAYAQPRVLVAFGCNGMGIALGSSIGQECAQLVA